MVLKFKSSIFHIIYYGIRSTIEFLIYKFEAPLAVEEENVFGKVVVITGANSGLGKWSAEALSKRGAKVILACRNLEEGRKALEEIKRKTGSKQLDLVELDLADLRSVRACASILIKKYTAIHLLINNAGILLTSSSSRTIDGFELHMGTNHLGHFLLTNLLLPLLGSGSRIVTVSSSIAQLTTKNINEPQPLPFISYANSKFANLLFTLELSRRVKGGVKCFAVCPGLARSNLSANFHSIFKLGSNLAYKIFGISLEKGCESTLYCALAKELCDNNGGGVMYRFGKRKWTTMDQLLNNEDNLPKDFWIKSQKLVGISE